MANTASTRNGLKTQAGMQQPRDIIVPQSKPFPPRNYGLYS